MSVKSLETPCHGSLTKGANRKGVRHLPENMFQIKKISDEGTSEPFVARLLIGVLELRDWIWTGPAREKEREKFDRTYDPVLTALRTLREAAGEVVSLLADHSVKITSGAIVEFQPRAVSFLENIDRPLHEAAARILVNGVIALKHMQNVTELFGIDIGGFFQRTANFERAMEQLNAAGHGELEQYLRSARSVWTEDFIQQRHDLEHGGWTLPQVEYHRTSPKSFRLCEPAVCALPVSEFAAISARRALAFVENVVIYAFKVSLPELTTIVEIPSDQRDPRMPRRFRVHFKDREIPEWVPRYSDNDFP